ncbi:MAG: hypothetical protein LiPW30_765 [Parcubacteria group bacterium LiPW_30]|nr:MAG: hypothetical protein LiPW30_765 [Parcubacteria group bacterium LiPW_30]
MYKNINNFQQKKGICYISDNSQKKFDYKDFYHYCNENDEMTEQLFEMVDGRGEPWQYVEYDYTYQKQILLAMLALLLLMFLISYLTK